MKEEDYHRKKVLCEVEGCMYRAEYYHPNDQFIRLCYVHASDINASRKYYPVHEAATRPDLTFSERLQLSKEILKLNPNYVDNDYPKLSPKQREEIKSFRRKRKRRLERIQRIRAQRGK